MAEGDFLSYAYMVEEGCRRGTTLSALSITYVLFLVRCLHRRQSFLKENLLRPSPVLPIIYIEEVSPTYCDRARRLREGSSRVGA